MADANKPQGFKIILDHNSLEHTNSEKKNEHKIYEPKVYLLGSADHPPKGAGVGAAYDLHEKGMENMRLYEVTDKAIASRLRTFAETVEGLDPEGTPLEAGKLGKFSAQTYKPTTVAAGNIAINDKELSTVALGNIPDRYKQAWEYGEASSKAKNNAYADVAKEGREFDKRVAELSEQKKDAAKAYWAAENAAANMKALNPGLLADEKRDAIRDLTRTSDGKGIHNDLTGSLLGFRGEKEEQRLAAHQTGMGTVEQDYKKLLANRDAANRSYHGADDALIALKEDRASSPAMLAYTGKAPKDGAMLASNSTQTTPTERTERVAANDTRGFRSVPPQQEPRANSRREPAFADMPENEGNVAQAAAILTSLDRNGDGQLKGDDFKSITNNAKTSGKDQPGAADVLFKAMDTDGDKKISDEEKQAAFAKAGITLREKSETDARISAAAGNWERKNETVRTPEENALAKEEQKAKNDRLVNVMDANKDGKLDKEDIKKTSELLRDGKHQELAKDIFKALDQDKTGVLKTDEGYKSLSQAGIGWSSNRAENIALTNAVKELGQALANAGAGISDTGRHALVMSKEPAHGLASVPPAAETGRNAPSTTR